MPITLIRTRFTEQTQKTITQRQNVEGKGNRKQHFSDLCQRAGCLLTGLYVSFITNEFVMIIDGTLEQVTRVKNVLRRSGAYSSIEVDILHSVEELTEDRAAVIEISDSWHPPDQDAIDRMLLDE